MKALAAIFFILFFVIRSSGQYYYNDIITTLQTNKQFALLKENNIKKIAATSREADGGITQHFLLQQAFDASGTKIITNAEYPSTGSSISTATYANGRIMKTVDSVDRIRSTVSYTYDDDKLRSINMLTEDDSANSVAREEHQWFYKEGLPVKMLLIKDGSDTTTVVFIKEEKGNIGEEQWYKKGVKVQDYFYYYDDQHRLTDIVRFNTRARRLLPDFLFEYNDNSQISSFTQVSGTGNYMIWRYIYNNNGLKQKEVLFNKEKQLVGTIEFAYN